MSGFSAASVVGKGTGDVMRTWNIALDAGCRRDPRRGDALLSPAETGMAGADCTGRRRGDRAGANDREVSSNDAADESSCPAPREAPTIDTHFVERPEKGSSSARP